MILGTLCIKDIIKFGVETNLHPTIQSFEFPWDIKFLFPFTERIKSIYIFTSSENKMMLLTTNGLNNLNVKNRDEVDELFLLEWNEYQKDN